MSTMAKLINLLLIERNMSKKELAKRIGISSSNFSGKLKRNNFSEQELHNIAKACNARFTGSFTLKDTNKEIK